MKNVEISTVGYVYTTYGLIQGIVSKKRINDKTGKLEYKLIGYNGTDSFLPTNFWYNAELIHKYYFIASIKEMFKPVKVWFIKKVLKK